MSQTYSTVACRAHLLVAPQRAHDVDDLVGRDEVAAALQRACEHVERRHRGAWRRAEPRVRAHDVAQQRAGEAAVVEARREALEQEARGGRGRHGRVERRRVGQVLQVLAAPGDLRMSNMRVSN